MTIFNAQVCNITKFHVTSVVFDIHKKIPTSTLSQVYSRKYTLASILSQVYSHKNTLTSILSQVYSHNK